MSKVSDQIDSTIDATVETAAKAAAPFQAAAELSADAAIKAVGKAAKPAAKPRAKAAAKPAAKRASKPRAKLASAVAARPLKVTARKPTRTAKVKALNARRKYVARDIAAAAVATAPLKQGIKTMTDTNWLANLATIPGASEFQAYFGDFSAKSQDVAKKGQAFAETLTESAKANLEAVVESSRIAAAGARDLGTELVKTTRSSVEHTSDGVKTLAEAKSPTEFFQIQSDLVRASFDRMVADGSKITGHMVKLAGEAVQPLSSRTSVYARSLSELSA